MTSRTRVRLPAAAVATAGLALTLAACGGGGGTDTTSAAISGLTRSAVTTQVETPWKLAADSVPRGASYSSASAVVPVTGQRLSVTVLDGSHGVHSVVCSSLGGVSAAAAKFLRDCAGLQYDGAEAAAARSWLAAALATSTTAAPSTTTFGGVRFALSSSPTTKTWILDLSPTAAA